MTDSSSRALQRAELSFRPRQVAVSLAAVVAFLMTMHLAVTYARFVLGREHVFGLVRMFDVVAEANVPSWWSSVLLLICAALLGVVARIAFVQRDRYRWHWLALGLLFVLLSLDEAAMIHEAVQAMLRRDLSRGDAEHTLASILYTSLLATIAFVGSARFLAALPRRTAGLFVLAGAMFVAGAIGVDFLGELHKSENGSENLVYALTSGLEEAMEMLAVTLFIYALLDHLQDASGRVTLLLPGRRGG